MTLVQTALRRPLTILVAAMAAALGAGLAWRQMPRDIFPTLGIPTIYVAQPYGGMDPAQMESFLTYFYEYHFLYITGIEHVESKSIQGAAILEAAIPPGHRHGASHVGNGLLREPSRPLCRPERSRPLSCALIPAAFRWVTWC